MASNRQVFTLRTTVSSDDSSNPAYSTAAELGENFKTGILEVTLGGTTPSWNVTPLYDNNSDDAFIDGPTLEISGSNGQIFRKKLNLTDVRKFQCRVDGSAGSAPTINIVLVAFD